jgi:hypothetical protein
MRTMKRIFRFLGGLPPTARQKWLNEAAIQLRVVAYFLSFSLIVLAFLYCETERSLSYLHSEFVRMDPHSERLLELYDEQLLERLRFLFATHAIALAVLAALGGILISHRIVGPIQRMSRFLAQIAKDEDPGHIRLRKNDFLKALADSLQEVADAKKPGKGGKLE